MKDPVVTHNNITTAIGRPIISHKMCGNESELELAIYGSEYSQSGSGTRHVHGDDRCVEDCSHTPLMH